MTSTIDKAVQSLSIAMSHINALLLTTSSAEDKEKLFFINHLLHTQQVSLIAYIECIKEKRRHARENKKKNNSVLKNFIRTAIQ